MCENFQNGASSGTLCSALCIRQDISAITCYSYRSTRKVKFRGTWGTIPIVFKSPTQITLFHWYENGKKTYPGEKQFLATLKAVTKKKLNMVLPLNTLMRIMSKTIHSKKSEMPIRDYEMDSLSTLVQDNEFLIMAIFPGNEVFPKILGTCGIYYCTEYMEPINIKSSLLSLTDSLEEWIQKLQISTQILELLNKLETDFHEPFHLCDIQLHHFGISSEDESLRYVNLNQVYPRSVISTMFRNLSCQTDEDCDINDCRSKCNKDLKICSEGVLNNNYQIVCEKIFLGWKRFNSIIIPGLLMSQHTPSDLASVLRQCANPGHEMGKPRMSSENFIKKRMYELIVEIEQTVVSQMSL
ncbi:hypothetical protein WA026_016372 [Henosepilachna vigintioctopunctata]|uniref:FAM69 protein-kinase domain-containing protein n=1 Tax=Henosepilachna vigintioctopunctata TaxID=420089 RepID=A0AAW1UCU0_9CUCU